MFPHTIHISCPAGSSFNNILVKRLSSIVRRQSGGPRALSRHTDSLRAHTVSLRAHTDSLREHTDSLRAHTDSLRAHTDSLRAKRSKDRIPMKVGSSEPVQSGPEAHPALYNGSFSGVKWPGHGVHHPPHLAPRLRKEYSYTSTSLPLWQVTR